MLDTRQFRVTVHLDSFFKDHRREARLFVNKSIKTIADLENRISEIFCINNFYLSCQNQFLPSTEDIRVLQEDEVVWVWQKEEANSVCSNSEKRTVHQQTEVETLLQKNEITETTLCKANFNNANSLNDIEMHNDSAATTKKEPESSDSSEEEEEEEDQKSISRDNSVSRTSLRSFKAMSSIGALMESLRSSTQNDDSFVNKRKRKRVRRRKQTKESSSFPNGHHLADATLDSTVTPRSSSVHLRFDESEEVTSPAEVTQQAPVYNYSVLKDEDFSKYPIMQNTLPREGDIISFKVLKISENYTPEISRNIVAKVINYDSINEKVNFKILYGNEELGNPHGKFFVEIEANDNADDLKEMYWKELVTPRLLFP